MRLALRVEIGYGPSMKRSGGNVGADAGRWEHRRKDSENEKVNCSRSKLSLLQMIFFILLEFNLYYFLKNNKLYKNRVLVKTK